VFNQAGDDKTAKRRRFLHACFFKRKNKLLVADHVGGIFIFDFEKNRFTNIQNCGQSCTAIATGLKRSNEYLVGLADSSVKCYSTDSAELVSWMRGHDSIVSSISVHSSGRSGVTTSRDTSQMWDLDAFRRIRKLNVRIEVPVLEVLFVPSTTTIITCFNDDSIFGWEDESFEWKFQLSTHGQKKIGYTTFAVTSDGLQLVAAGKSQLVHLYSLSTNELIQVINLPDGVRQVKQVHFLCDRFDNTANKILGVLCQDGFCRYVDMATCTQLFQISAHDKKDTLARVCCSNDNSSDFIVGLTTKGALVVYDVSVLMKDYDKPPGPIVRNVKEGKKRAGNSSCDVSTTSQSSGLSSGRMTVRRFKYSTKADAPPSDRLSMTRLRNILRGQGVFPERHRFFIWRHLLQLPENQSAFASLTDKGNHLAFAAVGEKFPVKSVRLTRVMQRILSAMGHWSRIFAEVEYLPLVVFPFVKLFQNNSLICFETIATFVVNWFQHWFEFFPNPPVNMMSLVENLIAHHDCNLLNHFIACKVTTQVYAWPVMQTLFSEVFSKNEWLRLFDHIFTNPPGFFYHLVAAYSMCCKSALLRTLELQDFKYFYHHRNALDVGAVIAEAYRISMTTPKSIDPIKILDDFRPIAVGETYPIYNKYPNFIVDYQSKERERIRMEELEYIKERQAANNLQLRMESRKQEEENWYLRKQILDDAEEERRKLLLKEEEKLSSQRKKLTAMKRELKTKELELLEKARMRFVNHQQSVRSVQIKRIEDEIKRKAFQRGQEKVSAISEVDIRSLELKIQKASLEQHMAFKQAEHDLKLKDEVHRRKNMMNYEDQNEHFKENSNKIDLTEAQKLQRELGSAELELNAINHRNDVMQLLTENDVEREKSLACSVVENDKENDRQIENADKIKQVISLRKVQIARGSERVRFLDEVQVDNDDRRKKLIQGESLRNCEKIARENEDKLKNKLESFKSSQHAGLDLINDDSVPIFSSCEDRTTAISNMNSYKQIEQDSSETSTWTYDSSRMDVSSNNQITIDRVRDLRRRLANTHKKPNKT